MIYMHYVNSLILKFTNGEYVYIGEIEKLSASIFDTPDGIMSTLTDEEKDNSDIMYALVNGKIHRINLVDDFNCDSMGVDKHNYHRKNQKVERNILETWANIKVTDYSQLLEKCNEKKFEYITEC